MPKLVRCIRCLKMVPVAHNCTTKPAPHDAPDGSPCEGLPVESLYVGGVIPRMTQEEREQYERLGRMGSYANRGQE